MHIPDIPPSPPAPPPAPDLAERQILDVRRRERLRLLAAAKRSGTVFTSAAGAAGSPTLGVPALLGGGGK